MSGEQLDRAKIENIIRQLASQLNELQTYIEVAQSRVAMIRQEIEELRLSYETISKINERKERNVIVALDRRGYAFVRAELRDVDKVLITLAREYVVAVPPNKALEILMNRNKDLSTALREAEAELKKLLDLHAQIRQKLEEYVALLEQSSTGQAPGSAH